MLNENQTKTFAKQTAMKALKYGAKLFKVGTAKFAAIALIVAIALFLLVGVFASVYMMIFEYPRMAREDNTLVISPYFEDDEEKYVELVATYTAQSDKFSIGLDSNQQEQARMHRLPEAVMIAVDQLLGDGTINAESTDRDWKSIGADIIYDALKPEFEWKESVITTTTVTTEEVDDGEGGTTTETTVEVDKEDVLLLAQVDAMEGIFEYTYEWVVEEYIGQNVSVTTEKEVLTSINLSPPYLERLRVFADKYDVKGNDFESLVLLAMAYDEAFERHMYDYGTDFAMDDGYNPFYVYTGPRSSIGGAIWPSAPEFTYISSFYGWRTLRGKRNWHGGLDISGEGIHGTPVFASLDGEVIYAGLNGSLTRGYGRLVIISNGNLGYGNVTTYYAHLNTIQTKKGAIVQAGDIIGTVGSTGNSTGPHLHFEYRINNERFDPLKYLFGRP